MKAPYPYIIARMTKKVNIFTQKSSFFIKIMLFLGIFVCFNASFTVSQVAFATEQKVANSADNFYFRDFTADYYLSRDHDGVSHLKVVEQFTAIFPNYSQNHGITRAIPYTNQAGKNFTISNPRNFSIKILHNGQKEKPHKVELQRGDILVYIGNADEYVTGEQQYTLEYEFERVITDFGDFQELYWDTNGDRWAQSFSQITARVHFVDSPAKHNYTGNAWCYIGAAGENGSERCEIERLEDGVSFHADDLNSYENLTFDLEFKPGTFAVPAPQQDHILVQVFTIECVIAGILIIYMLYVYSQIHKKRRFYKNLFETVQYLPPRDVSIAEAAKIYLKGVGSADQVATLLEMAVQHKIELIKDPQGQKWSVRVKTINLTPEQSIVLHVLKGDRYALTEGEIFEVKQHHGSSKLAELVQNFQTIVKNNLTAKGFLEAGKVKKNQTNIQKDHISLTAAVQATNTRTVTEKLCTSLIVLSFLWVILCIIGISYIEDNVMDESLVYAPELFWPLMIGIMIVVAGVLLACGAWCSQYASRTEKGLALSRYLDGLKLYIKMAEKDRLALLQSVKGADLTHQGIVRLYEKLLPYAIIFGQEKSWLDEMGRYYAYDDVGSPSWYLGAGIFSAHEFSSAVNAATHAVNSSIRSASPSSSSSSSSGGGGGGFSGGGGGGGGGGGW